MSKIFLFLYFRGCGNIQLYNTQHLELWISDAKNSSIWNSSSKIFHDLLTWPTHKIRWKNPFFDKSPLSLKDTKKKWDARSTNNKINCAGFTEKSLNQDSLMGLNLFTNWIEKAVFYTVYCILNTDQLNFINFVWNTLQILMNFNYILVADNKCLIKKVIWFIKCLLLILLL